MHPRLKAKQRTVIWHGDLETTIKELYDLDINVLDMVFEPNNGSYYDFTVDGTKELTDIGDIQIVAKWIATGKTDVDMTDVAEYSWSDSAEVEVRHILFRLFIEGHIPAGEYTISCWW